MAFLVDEAYLPAVLTAPQFTDEDFAALCAEHPDLFFETSASGELIIMPPPYSLTGVRQGKLFARLNQWAEADGRGIAGEATTAFVLPNGARRAPDAAWTLRSKIRALDPAMLERYWHLCPDFVIELRSQTDRIQTLRAKMREWTDNGTHLAWLVDPETRTVEIHRPNREPEVLTNPDAVKGEGLLEGFTLDLKTIWDPLAE